MNSIISRSFTGLCLSAAIICTSLLSSCSSSRKATEIVEQSQSQFSPRADFLKVVDSQKSWTQLQVPIKISITKPEKFSISGRAYMIRNERIYISMRMIGMEVAILDIQPDSIHFYDKYHKEYVAESINSILSNSGLTLANIQDALLGRIFMPGNEPISDKSYKKTEISQAEKSWTLTPKKKFNGYSCSFILGKADDTLEQLTVSKAAQTFSAQYSSPANTDKGRFMQQISVNAKAGKTPLELRIATTMKSVKFSANQKGWNNRPEGYKRVTLQSLLKSLKL